MRPPLRLTRRALLKGSLAATAGTAVTTLLAACGTAGGTATVTTPPVATGGAAGAATPAASAGGRASGLDPAKPVTIDYWRVQTGNTAIRENIRRFSEANPGVTVADKVYPNFPAIIEAVQAAVAAKTPPAVVWIGYNYLNYAATNIPHLRIDEAAKRDTQGQGEVWLSTNFAPNVLDLGRVNGVQHGMPFGISNPIFYFNADLFKQAGLDRGPQTWSEVRDYARRVKEQSGNGGLIIPAVDLWQYQAIIETNGARALIGSGAEARTGLDSPEAIEAMQLLGDMAVRDKSIVRTDVNQGIQSFSAGQAGMLMLSSASFTNVSRAASFALGTTAFPTFGTKPRRIPAGGGNLFIFATDPLQQMASWELVKFLNAPESLTAWVKESGIFPGRTGLIDDPRYLKPFLDENRLLKPAVDQLPAAVPFVSWPGRNGLQASQEFFDACNRVVAGEPDVPKILRDASGRINQLLKG